MKQTADSNRPADTSTNTNLLNFFDAQLYPFTMKTSKGKGEIKCNSKSFDGVDPLPGQSKQCFCARKNSVNAETMASIQKFWEARNEIGKLESEHFKVQTEKEVATQLAEQASRVSHDFEQQLASFEQQSAEFEKQKEMEDKKQADQEFKAQTQHLEDQISKLKAEADKDKTKYAEVNKEKEQTQTMISNLQQRLQHSKTQTEYESLQNQIQLTSQILMKKSVEAAMLKQQQDSIEAVISTKENQERAIMVQKVANEMVVKDTAREFEKLMMKQMKQQRYVGLILDEAKSMERLKEVESSVV